MQAEKILKNHAADVDRTHPSAADVNLEECLNWMWRPLRLFTNDFRADGRRLFPGKIEICAQTFFGRNQLIACATFWRM
jgi:hypothetical protein